MYICYDKLWKLIASKKLSKTDLCNLTGISSRTMAKLSKNQSVTTDTLLHICVALTCDISDIAEIKSSTEAESIYQAYCNSGKMTIENDTCKTIEFDYMGVPFSVKELKKATNKRSLIHCEPNGSVFLEQLYSSGISPARETICIFHPAQIKKDKVTILLITGTPGNITGLDNGIVHSARTGCVNGNFYVMSMGAFKLFDWKK